MFRYTRNCVVKVAHKVRGKRGCGANKKTLVLVLCATRLVTA
ncbi:hypothetical protein [Campylobacter troglodytis]|nr:hypothetical protein [Campylobacter troglodytis]